MRIPETDLLKSIKERVVKIAPDAQVILYGSHARGDFNIESDWDILILLNSSKVGNDIKKRITDPLYDLEFDTGEIISPLVLSKYDWEQKYIVTTLYRNIVKEGKPL